MSELPEHVARNRAYWDGLARQYIEAGELAWAQEEPTWGIWQVPEAQVRAFSEQMADKDAIELGCGTAYISAWLSRRGARIVGVDNSEAQLSRRAACSGSTGSIFPSSTATLKRSLTPTGASTSRFPNMARASGRIHSAGFPRPRVCCGRVAS